MRLPLRWEPGPRRPRFATTDRDAFAFERLRSEVEAGLREIDFEEVTLEDRVTFIEQVVVWQMRRALWAHRFDLALRLHDYAVKRIAALACGEFEAVRSRSGLHLSR